MSPPSHEFDDKTQQVLECTVSGMKAAVLLVTYLSLCILVILVILRVKS